MKHLLFLLICLHNAFCASSSSSSTHERPLTLTETHELFASRLKTLDPNHEDCKAKLSLLAPDIFALAHLVGQEKREAIGLSAKRYVNCEQERDLFWTTPVLFPHNATSTQTLSDIYLNFSSLVLWNLTDSLLTKIHFNIRLIELFKQEQFLPCPRPQEFTSRRFFDLRDQYQNTLILLLKLNRNDQAIFLTPKILKLIPNVSDDIKYAKKRLTSIARQPYVISPNPKRQKEIAIEMGCANPNNPTFEERARIAHVQKLDYYMELVQQDPKLKQEALNYLYNRLLQKWYVAKIIACHQNKIQIEATPFFRNSIDVQSAHAANEGVRMRIAKTSPSSASFKNAKDTLFQNCLTACEFIKMQRQTLSPNPPIQSITLQTRIMYQGEPTQTLKNFINTHTHEELHNLLCHYEARKTLNYLLNNFYVITGNNKEFPLTEQTTPFKANEYFSILDQYKATLRQTKIYFYDYLVQRGLITSINKDTFLKKNPLRLAPSTPLSPEKLFLREIQRRYEEGCQRNNSIIKDVIPEASLSKAIIMTQTIQRIMSYCENEARLFQPELCRIKQNLMRKLAIISDVNKLVYDPFHQFWLLDKPIILSKTQPLSLPKTLKSRTPKKSSAASSSTPVPLPLVIKYEDKETALQMLAQAIRDMQILKQKRHKIVGDDRQVGSFSFSESLTLDVINTIVSHHIRRYCLEKWLTDLYIKVQGKFPLLLFVPDDAQKYEEEKDLYTQSKHLLKIILLDHLCQNKLADGNLLDIKIIKTNMPKSQSRLVVLNKISAISAINEHLKTPAFKKSIPATIREISSKQQIIREQYFNEIDEKKRLAAAEKRKQAEEAKRIEGAKKAEEAKKRAQELAAKVKAVEVTTKPPLQPKPTTPKPPTKKQLAREKKERREANRLKALQEQKERNRKEAEALAIRKAEEAEARRIAAEEEARRIAAEKEARRIAAEEEARRIAAEKEARRIAAEEEARRIAAEKEARRIAAEEEARRIAAEMEARRIAMIHDHLDRIEKYIDYLNQQYYNPSLSDDGIGTYYQIRVMKSERQKLLDQLPEEDVVTESDSDDGVIFEPSEWTFN